MNSKSPMFQFFKITTKTDWKRYLTLPVVFTLVLSWVLSYGDIQNVVNYLIDIVPVVSSILLGFLGMIMVASLSNNSIFDKMRETNVNDVNVSGVSAYRIFFIGLFANLLSFMMLLSASLLFGSLNKSFTFDTTTYIVETAIILFLIMSSTSLFINNMDRVYQVTIHLN